MLQTCKRKSFYRLHENLIPKIESDALGFGTAIHTFLEHWYGLPIGSRELLEDAKTKSLLEAYSHGHAILEEQQGALESIRRFVIKCIGKQVTLEESDKRSIHNGIKICKAYAKHYAQDNMIAYVDEQGPFIERKFETLIHEEQNLKIYLFGTIDVALQNPSTGTIFIGDHKTTAALGSEFFNRLKPNHQYTGYILGAREAFGIKTNTFMINGIQIAKTKTEFARQFTSRDEEDFAELKTTIVHEVKSYLHCLLENSFPMGPVSSCASYGGCFYRTLCEVPSSIRKNVTEANFKNE